MALHSAHKGCMDSLEGSGHLPRYHKMPRPAKITQEMLWHLNALALLFHCDSARLVLHGGRWEAGGVRALPSALQGVSTGQKIALLFLNA